MKKTITLLFVLICSTALSDKASSETSLTGEDVLVIGIPFYRPSQLSALKLAIQNISDVQLVYVCQQQKTFLLKYDSLEYPQFDYFIDKIKQVDTTFVVYRKYLSLSEFTNECSDEVQKQ
jgi:hypothetical protein